MTDLLFIYNKHMKIVLFVWYTMYTKWLFFFSFPCLIIVHLYGVFNF